MDIEITGIETVDQFQVKLARQEEVRGLQSAICETVPNPQAAGISAEILIKKATSVEEGLLTLCDDREQLIGCQIEYRPAGPNTLWEIQDPYYLLKLRGFTCCVQNLGGVYAA